LILILHSIFVFQESEPKIDRNTQEIGPEVIENGIHSQYSLKALIPDALEVITQSLIVLSKVVQLII
jgi:hypothetical protein